MRPAAPAIAIFNVMGALRARERQNSSCKVDGAALVQHIRAMISSHALHWIAKHKRRLAATLAMLLLFQLSNRIPIPGLPDALFQYRESPMFSISGGGIYAWMLAVAVLELALLAFSRLRNSDWVEGGHVYPGAKLVALLSLALVVYQTYSAIAGMWTYVLPGSYPSWFNLAVISTTAAAGLIATMLIAAAIDRFGLGFGFWTLILWVTAKPLASDLFDLLARLRFRLNAEELIYQQWEVWIQMALVVIAAGLAATFVRLTVEGGEKNPLNSVWPFFMSALLSPLTFQLLFIFLSQVFGPESVQNLFRSYYFGFWWIVDTLMTLIFVWIYSRGDIPARLFWAGIVAAGIAAALPMLTFAIFTSFEGSAVNSAPLKFVIAAAALRYLSGMAWENKEKSPA